jgi:hypothetical protein
MAAMARRRTALTEQLSLGLREQLDAQARAGRIKAVIDAPLGSGQTSLQLRLLTVYRKAQTPPAAPAPGRR